MYSVSNDFKNALKAPTRSMSTTVTNLDTFGHISSDDDLVSVKINSVGNIAGTVMSTAEIEYTGSHFGVGQNAWIFWNVFINSVDSEQLNFPVFKIESIEFDKATGVSKAKAFDAMYDTLQQYALEPIYDIVFPCTLLELLQAISAKLWSRTVSGGFPNESKVIPADIFSGQNLTYRDVLDDMAEASGSILYIRPDGIPEIKTIKKTTADVVETLDAETLNSLKLETKYGEINTITLAREPQADYITDISA